MKAILKFNLPEEINDLDVTLKAQSFRTALFDISKVLRSQEKYDGPPLTREAFLDIISNYDLQEFL